MILSLRTMIDNLMNTNLVEACAGDERHGGNPAGRLHQRVLILDGPPAGEPYRGGLSDHSEDLPAAPQGRYCMAYSSLEEE